MIQHAEDKATVVTSNAHGAIGEMQLTECIENIRGLAINFRSTGPDNYLRKMEILINWLEEALERAQALDRVMEPALDVHGEDHCDLRVGESSQDSPPTLERAAPTRSHTETAPDDRLAGDLRVEADTGRPDPSSLQPRRQLGRQKRCNHDPDFDRAQIADWLDNWCEVGVECRRCGEDGFASIRPDRIRWNDED